MSDLLLSELQAILDACGKKQVPVFVVGAFSIHAYDCLIRSSKDLDLAIAPDHWPPLKEILESLGYTTAPVGVWVAASKVISDTTVEVHIALGGVTDFNTGATYSVADTTPELHRPADMDFALPVLPVEEVLITKLLPLRDKDVIDLVRLCSRQFDAIDPKRFWYRVEKADLMPTVTDQLANFGEILENGEVLSIWYDQLQEVMSDEEREAALKLIQRLLKSKPK